MTNAFIVLKIFLPNVYQLNSCMLSLTLKLGSIPWSISEGTSIITTTTSKYNKITKGYGLNQGTGSCLSAVQPWCNQQTRYPQSDCNASNSTLFLVLYTIYKITFHNDIQIFHTLISVSISLLKILKFY
jgi:hypothetical protein